MPRRCWYFRLQPFVVFVLALAAACGGQPGQAPKAAATITVEVRGDQLEITPGTSCTFTAIVSGTFDTRVKWSVTSGTITGEGVFVPPEISTGTTVEVTATSYADPKAAGKLSVRVSPRLGPSILYFRAAASAISAGENTTLQWHVQNANRIEISQIGKVNAEGSREIAPTATTDYTLTAAGPGGATSATTRVTVSPLLHGVSPNSGSVNGGDRVVVAGAGFQSDATVMFGGVAARDITVASSTEIDATTPAHAAGVVDVMVTAPGAPSATLNGVFTYVAPPAAIDRYISPSGSDSNAGLDPAFPWKTIAHAAANVPAGGVIHAAAGNYIPANIDCGAGARQGTSANPITLIAEPERGAIIQGSATGGYPYPLDLQHCSYWTVQGFVVKDADYAGTGLYHDGNIRIAYGDHVTVRRNLLAFNDRYYNTPLIAINYSNSTLIEENELYSFNKHGISFYYGNYTQDQAPFSPGGRNIARRNYCNSRSYPDITAGFVTEDAARGDQCILVYAESGALLENNISEGQWHGFEVRPGGTAHADNTLLYGNVSIDDVQGFHIEANSGAGAQTQDDAHMPHGTVFVDNVAISGYQTTAGFSLESAKTSTLDRNTAITVQGQTGFQFIRHAENRGDGSFSVHIDRALATQTSTAAQGNGFYGYAPGDTLTITGDNVDAYNWAVPYPDFSSLTNQAIADPQLGACKAWRPDGSWAKSNSVGADVLYRYENGSLQTTPLWADDSSFPHGAIVSGLNDASRQSLVNLPARLAVNTANCPFPPGYGGQQETHKLNVTVTGTGLVTSTPVGISCSPNCTGSFNAGTSVTLTASNGSFQQWQGDCAGATSPCVLIMDRDRNVTATFASPPAESHLLTVAVSGSGSVVSTIPDGRISCGSNCSASFNDGQSVTLQARAAGSARFTGWNSPQGVCAGTDATCIFTMSGAITVNAGFTMPALGDYSLGNPPPSTWYPYIASGTGANNNKALFNQPLPGNCFDQAGATCSGGILAHENHYQAVQDISKYALGMGCDDRLGVGVYSGSGCGYWSMVFPAGTSSTSNAGADQGFPWYFCKSDGSDCVWYKFTNKGTNVTMLCPNQAMFGGGTADVGIACYDQKQQLLMTNYNFGGGSGKRLPDNHLCPGSGPSTCALDITSSLNYVTVSATGTSPDADHYVGNYPGKGYTLGGQGGGATGLGNSAMGATMRFREYSDATASNYATINHAVQLGLACGYTSSGGAVSNMVFPHVTGLMSCQYSHDHYNVAISNTPLWPAAGQLFVLDYTKAQIDAMPISPVRKAMLRAWSRYGSYFGATGGNVPAYAFTAVTTVAFESQTSYSSTGTAFPFINSIANGNSDVSIDCGSYARGQCPGNKYDTRVYATMFAGIGKVRGPGGTDKWGNSCSSGTGMGEALGGTGGCYPTGHIWPINACVPKGISGEAAGCQ